MHVENISAQAVLIMQMFAAQVFVTLIYLTHMRSTALTLASSQCHGPPENPSSKEQNGSVVLFRVPPLDGTKASVTSDPQFSILHSSNHIAFLLPFRFQLQFFLKNDIVVRL